MADVTVYKKTALTGNTASSLDGIDGGGLLDGDMAFVTVSDVLYVYILDDDSGAAESSPDVISPDTNPGNKRWLLQSAGTRIDDLLAAEDNTDLDVSTTAHGLCPKLEDSGTKFLRDDGGWETPTAGLADMGLEYNILSIDAAAMVGCTTNPPEFKKVEYGTNDIDTEVWAFDGGATEERVQFKTVMPENWDRGTLKAKFIWTGATGSSANDTVEWAVKARAFGDSDAIDTALGTPQVITDTLIEDDGTDFQITDATPAFTVDGTPALHDLIVFEFYRNTDGIDDMAEDAYLSHVIIQYKMATDAVAAW